MVRDAAEPAGAGEAAAGFGAAEAAVGLGEERVVEDGLFDAQGAAGEVAVYFLPGSVVLDRAWRVGVGPDVVVEVSDGEDAGVAGGGKRVYETPHTLHSDGAPALRGCADLGRVVIHQNIDSFKLGKQDVARPE